jgi:hypothetical protein
MLLTSKMKPSRERINVSAQAHARSASTAQRIFLGTVNGEDKELAYVKCELNIPLNCPEL